MRSRRWPRSSATDRSDAAFLISHPPDPAQYPGALPHMQYAGSLLFVRPDGPVDRRHIGAARSRSKREEAMNSQLRHAVPGNRETRLSAHGHCQRRAVSAARSSRSPDWDGTPDEEMRRSKHLTHTALPSSRLGRGRIGPYLSEARNHPSAEKFTAGDT